MVVEQVLENNYEVTDEDINEEFDALKEKYGDFFETIYNMMGLQKNNLKLKLVA